MIKVVHFCSDTNVGGAGVTLHRLLKCSDKSIFEHYVVLPNLSSLSTMFESLDVKTIYYSSTADRSFSFCALREFKSIIKEIAPHIVHTHGLASARIAAYLCGVRSRIYTRHTYSETTPSLAFRFINNLITTKAVAVNDVLVDQMISCGIDKEKILKIENGCGSGTDNVAYLLNESPMNDSFTLMYHGRIIKEKGLDVALSAMSKLKKENIKINLYIVGEGDHKAELKRKTGLLDISDRVTFLPYTKDVFALLRSADASINCSYKAEGTSNSIIEAMSAGKPVIASRVGGNINLIEHEKNGLLFCSGDADAFCECVLRIASDSCLYQELSEGALDTYKKRFTEEKMTQRYEALWKDEYKKYYENE